MARQRLITRTITFQETAVMTLNIETAQAHTQVFVTANPAPLTIDQLKARYDTDSVKLVAVVSNRTTEQVFGMLEEDFMKYAHSITR